jgi:two-component system response regulator FixJ
MRQASPDPGEPGGPERSTHLYIVDDDQAVARTVGRAAATIGFTPQTFGSAADFLKKLGELEGGCVLLDIRMPGMDGLELLEQLRERRPGWPVVMLTGHAEVGAAVRSFRSGAVHFLSKPFRKSELLDALKEAAEIGRRRQRLAASRQQVEALEKLSKREQEVLAAIADGKQSKMIAWELGISVRTVDLHRSNILAKLCARNTSQAVAIARAGGSFAQGSLSSATMAENDRGEEIDEAPPPRRR